MKRLVILITVAIMSISITACGSKNSKNNMSEKEAQKIALEKSGGGDVVRSNLDKDREGDTFEFEIVNGDYKFEIDVDAASGHVLNFDKENISGNIGGNNSNNNNSNNNNSNNNSSNTTISIEEARKAALEKSGGGEIVNEIEEFDDGAPTFEFDIINGDYKIDVTVSANDGSILSFEKEPNTIFD